MQTLDKQKQKVEEEKKSLTSLKNENQSLIESCDALETKRQKLEHEGQTKDTRISCLEGQLNRAQQSLDAEIAKV